MTLIGLKLAVLLPVVALLALLRWTRAGMLAWAVAWWLALFVVLKFAFVTPIPGSVRTIYLTILTAALCAYVSSDPERWASFSGPTLRLVLEPRYRLLLGVLVLLFPALAALSVYARMSVPVEAPSFARTIHPAPPDKITVHDHPFDLTSGVNPYRELERSDPAAFGQHLEDGRRVYYQNCFYCHGDAMAGDGMFVHGLNPIPSNFTDKGVLPNLEEGFVFWRVAKGGPGMPAEGGPWDSAMPVWEQFLTEEEIWNVVMYLYAHTENRPRAKEVVH